MASGNLDDTPWDDFLSDFTLILDTGERLKCHKLVLAKASPVFTTMLKRDTGAVITTQMKMSGYDLETVTAFLQFSYDNLNLFHWSHGFDTKMFNDIKLLRLAHQYEVKDLKDECISALKLNQDPQRAYDIWKAGEEMNVKELKLSRKSMLRLMHTANSFQVLTCGTCQVTTENPAMQCSCCGHLTVRKENEHMVGEELSKVSFRIPPTESPSKE